KDYEDRPLLERERRIRDAEKKLAQEETKGYIGGCATTAIPATNTDIENHRISQIQERLKYHAPNHGQLARYQALRDAALAFSTALVRNVPSSQELNRALRLIEDALMTANKGIALENTF